MSAAVLEVFDTKMQKTNYWLNDLMQIVRWLDKHKDIKHLCRANYGVSGHEASTAKQ